MHKNSLNCFHWCHHHVIPLPLSMGCKAVKKCAEESKARKKGKAEASNLPLAPDSDVDLPPTATESSDHMVISNSDALEVKVRQFTTKLEKRSHHRSVNK
jgi:hypothetical protein